MKLLFFGDIVGKIGRRGLQQVLPGLRREFGVDLVIANVENLAHGKGITRETLLEMKEAGIDVFTSGNHVFRKGGWEEILTGMEFNILRPANYPPQVPGRGYCLTKAAGIDVAVINLMGRVFFKENLDDPFRKLDEILAELKTNIRPLITIVDWHAEATSEKTALGWYADGRVTAVLGTHTHVPTADTRLLPRGTAFISDAGMNGAKNSILGVEPAGPLSVFATQVSSKFVIPEAGLVQINSVYLDIDEKTGLCRAISRVDRETMVE